ncbi:MAG: hypothetical protein ABJB74_08880 [Gemmatimonas sp.]
MLTFGTRLKFSSRRFWTLALAATVITACGGDATLPTASTTIVPGTVTALSGNGQSAITGSALAQSLVVKVSSSSGAPVSGATVTFAVTSGSATLSASQAQTDNNGTASTQVTVGTIVGAVVIEATVSGTPLSAKFSVTAVASASDGTCATPLNLTLGAAAIVTGSSVCISGGASGAEFALIPFNSSTTASSRSTFSVQPSGTTTVLSALSSSDGVAALGSASMQASVDGQRAFEIALRARERVAMKAASEGARSWFASRSSSGGARLNTIPATATVGSLYSLNSNADDACTNARPRAGRVMAVGRKAMVVADTLNPAGGFTQTDYASIAATFDDVVDDVDTKTFGDPTDIDGNGHVILYFTSAVNSLTPKGASYYIGGFFYGRDLLPTTASAIGSCATSNVAEMFYLLVPDPNGSINGNTFSKTFVTSATISTVAHEYEHLINASRRLYVNTAAIDFEETWLDEGLAHMAEELLFYKRSGLSPLSNISATLLRSNETYRAVFNDDGIGNFGRLQSFLLNPSTNSPYAGNDSLGTRGATWSFLRYAIDQQSASQETVLRQLVNSTTTGLSNLRNVFGSELTPLFRDWATAFALDDVSGAATRYSFRSWNIASVSSALTEAGTYPLATQSLVSGTTKSVDLNGGGAAYLRFGVASGGAGTLSWSTPATVLTTVVRLK